MNHRTHRKLFVYLRSAWRRSHSDSGREAGVSPPVGGHECLEVGNYGVGDKGRGEIRFA